MKSHRSLLRYWLLSRSVWMEERVQEYAEKHGYGDMPMALIRFLLQLDDTPIGLSDLARRMSVSRQAVHKLALEAERLGIGEFVDSEVDGRVRMLRLSREGQLMSEMAARDFERIEHELAAQIGTENVETLKRILTMAWTNSEQQAT